MKVNDLVFLIEPLGFIDYNKLQIESFVVLSDSGTIFEESSILNFRALNIRESHERPEAVEETSVVVTGLNIERIIQGIKMIENQTTGNKRNISLVPDYNIPNVSLKIERIILSHIDFVNRVVWQKRILIYTNHFFLEQFKINEIVNWIVEEDFEIRVVTGLPNYPSGKIYRGYGFKSICRNEHNGRVTINRLPLIPRGNGNF